MRDLRRDFLPRDLEPHVRAADLDGVISVQARHSLAESRFLLKQHRAFQFVLGVVGWVPLVERNVGDVVEEFAEEPGFLGCRHALQDEPDDDFMLRKDFNRGIRTVTAAGLVYDILIYERHLPQAKRLVDRHPKQVFVLDHIGKPRISEGSFHSWCRNIVDLALRPNVYCKLSGMVTEADWHSWTYAQLTPYLETVLEAFGAGRLMYGSDWPVCLPATTYARWFGTVSRFLEGLTESEQDRILGGTAAGVYGISPVPATMAASADRPCR